MARKKMINVNVAELAKPITVKKVQAGTRLDDFLEEIGIQYSSKVRVNAETVQKRYILKDGDIVSTIGAVSGGKK